MKHRCLIIDDEVLARDVIRTFVQHDHSIEITDEAANGSEAVVKNIAAPARCHLSRHPDA